MKAVTSFEMQALDREAMDAYGIPGLILMENAGAGICRFLKAHYKDLLKNGVMVVAGPGNNGGDGFVVARRLHQEAIEVEVFVLALREKFRGDAQTNLEIIERLHIPIHYITSDPEVEDSLRPRVPEFGFVVDAIFGTGLKRPVGGRFARVIRLLNESASKIVAVDIPSGISADSGEVLGMAVKAHLTVTMAMPKIGHLVAPGLYHTGELEVVDIGIPKEAVKKARIPGELLTRDSISARLRPRPTHGHKGTFGHVLIIAGSRGKTGACALSALGALRSGAGLVTVASPASAQEIISKIIPKEAMTLWLDEDTASGEVSDRAIPRLMENLKGKKAVVVGPGVGLGCTATEVQKWVVSKCHLPVVVDADALTVLAKDVSIIKNAKGPRVLTPHPGEMARLMDKGTEEIQKDRINAARELAAKTGAIVCLKGERTIIAAPDGGFAINPTGNAGMGQGGMGDSLSGIIGGLLTQGYGPYEASTTGVFVHGLAGDLLTSLKGPFGYTATELSDQLPCVWRLLYRK